MQEPFEFYYYGEIRGQGRPRFTRKGHAFKDAKDREYERKIKSAFINSGGHNFGNVPIKIIVDVYRQIPKSRKKSITREPDVFKPDASNCLKAIEDALNGLAYNDDKQIVCAKVRKHPRERDRSIDYVKVTIMEVCDA